MPRGKNLLAAILGTVVALLLAESGVRLFWRDAPSASGSRDDLPLQQVRDPGVLYRLVPNSSGSFNGTAVEINSLGLRDREYAIPAERGVARVLVLGDSMVFGVGVPPEETLPGHLSRILAPAEAINAGVFGYNLDQETSLLEDIAPVYRPDLIVSCFVHNDIENWGLDAGGRAVPEIKSSRFEPPPRDAWSSRLADLLLPETFDPDRLNLLPRGGGDGGVRRFLAAHSRLYLFTYLRLRTHAWNMTGGETREPLIGSPACEADQTIWTPLREGFRRQARIARDHGARYMVVVLNGQLWQGLPLMNLERILREEEIPFLDLTPVWIDRETYARQYTLGWDPHPNSRANALAASLIADYVDDARLLSGNPPDPPPGPYDPILAKADLADRVESWRRAQEQAVLEDREAWSRQIADLPRVIDFEMEPSADYPRVLHGFWRADEGIPTGGAGRWMSSSGAVLLGRERSDIRIEIDVSLPASDAARGHTPPRLEVILGTPPGACSRFRQVIPVAGGTGSMVLSVRIPPELAGAEALEVRLAVDQPYRAAYLDTDGTGKDARLVSFLIRRIRVMPMEDEP